MFLLTHTTCVRTDKKKLSSVCEIFCDVVTGACWRDDLGRRRVNDDPDRESMKQTNKKHTIRAHVTVLGNEHHTQVLTCVLITSRPTLQQQTLEIVKMTMLVFFRIFFKLFFTMFFIVYDCYFLLSELYS